MDPSIQANAPRETSASRERDRALSRTCLLGVFAQLDPDSSQAVGQSNQVVDVDGLVVELASLEAFAFLRHRSGVIDQAAIGSG
jgi:hypothetical protein